MIKTDQEIERHIYKKRGGKKGGKVNKQENIKYLSSKSENLVHVSK